MTARAEIYETEVQNVQIGDNATVTSPAFPAAIAGKVVRIGTMVSKNKLYDLDPTAPADQRVVMVKVSLDDAQVAKKFVNLQVTVTIETKNKK
jgi:HlyD family secretion protein